MSAWPTVPLLEVCRAYQPQTIGRKDMVDDGPYPVYGANGAIGRYHSFNHEESEVLLGCRGSCGSVNVCEPQSWVTGNAMVIKPRDHRLSKEFLRYFLDGSEEIAKTITGVAQPQITQKSLAPVSMPLPPIEEQRRIVAVLDEVFAAIATASANAEKNLVNARELFDSELDVLVEDARATFPGRALTDHCRRVTVGHVGPMKDRYQSDGIPFLRSQNVRPFQIELDGVAFIDEAFDEELVKSRLTPGDVVVVRTGYPGTAAVIPSSLPISNCADLVIVRPGVDLNPHYLASFLNSNLGKRMIAGNLVGAAQKHFNVGAAKKVAIPLPPLAEQKRFVARVDELRAMSGQLVEVYQHKLGKLTTLKQALLHRAFSSQLTEREPLAA